jgi:hypothetical protein
MIVDARKRADRERYSVLLDGFDISEAIQTADDVAHEVTIVLRKPNGEPFRRADQAVLTATVRGRVTLVPRVNAAQMVTP